MIIFSALTKVRELIAPFNKGNTPSPTSTPTRPDSALVVGLSPTQQESNASDLHRVETCRISKSKPSEDRGKGPLESSSLHRWLDEQDNHQHERDMDGDTLINDAEVAADATDYADDTLVIEELTGQVESSDRFISYKDPRYTHWAREEIWLFNKLSKRGLEPLLRDEWQLDFLSFPESLFSKNEKLIFINNLNTVITEATNELVVLIDAGPRCRDAMLQHQRPEPALKKGIERYKRWSLRDAKMQRKPHLDLITIAAASTGESVESVVSRITNKFHLLGQQWRDRLRQPSYNKDDERQIYSRQVPTLYGFVIKSTIVAVMTYDASTPLSRVRSLVTLDHSKDGEDVWHALAISIVCCRARNHLLQLEKEGYIAEEILDEDDPDA